MGYEFLQRLREGDYVVLNWAGTERLERVERTTKTQVCVAGMRFRKADGRRTPHIKHDMCFIAESTPVKEAKLKARQERAALLYKIEQYNYSQLTLAQLRRLANMLEEMEVENE